MSLIVVPPPDEVIAIVRRHQDFATAFRAMQDRLGISNQCLDDLGLCPGQTDKALGRSQQKGLGPMLFNAYAQLLALEFRAYVNIDAAKRMQEVWEGRAQAYVRRDCTPFSTVTLERAKPEILREMSRLGVEARRLLPPGKKQAIARKASRARARLPKAERSEISRRGWIKRRRGAARPKQASTAVISPPARGSAPRPKRRPRSGGPSGR